LIQFDIDPTFTGDHVGDIFVSTPGGEHHRLTSSASEHSLQLVPRATNTLHRSITLSRYAFGPDLTGDLAPRATGERRRSVHSTK
jgi:hypothetical protein